MKWLKLHAFLTLCFLSFLGRTEELPPVENFFPYQYNAGNQNWDISQSSDKLIYVANNNGLLEFNGAIWRLYPSPNETIMRSVTVLGDIIYSGSYMDFGFWEKNKFGALEYTSLSDELDLRLLNDEEFWNILGIENWVVFQSLNRIYIYDRNNETIKIIESDGIINKMFVLDETIYFQKLNQGIYKIVNGQESVFIEDSTIGSSEVVNLFKEGDKIVILTRSGEFLSYEDGRLNEWGSYNEVLSNLSIYDAIRLKNKNFALGTISNGLIYFNQDQGIIHEINQNNGIQNNTVLSVFEDIDGNIWTGLDNGISYINIDAPINIYNDKDGVLGSVYASAIFRDNIYLGTNQGLFYKPMNDKGPFVFIKKTQGQVWSLQIIENELFCGHHRGTFTVQGNKVNKVADTEGTWIVKRLDDGSDVLIQGNYDGLHILTKSKSQGWQARNRIEGFNNSARSFEVLPDRILVNHEYKGVFHLTVDQSYSEVTSMRLDTLLKGENSSMAKYKNDILYAYDKGILKYNSANDAFVRDSILSSIYTEENYISGKIIPSKLGDRFWTFTKDNITVVSSGNLSDVPKLGYLPLNLDVRRDVIEYENISSINGRNKYLLGTSFGYITFDHEGFSIDDFEVKIGSVSNGINNDHSASGYLVDKSILGEYESDQNNLKIDFYTPTYYKYLNPNYQFQLVGIYDAWSEWDAESSVFFENLLQDVILSMCGQSLVKRFLGM